MTGSIQLFIQPGKPNQNAFIERFNRSFRQEVLDAWLFNVVSEVQTAADDWLSWLRRSADIKPTGAADAAPVGFMSSCSVFTVRLTIRPAHFFRCLPTSQDGLHKC